MPYWATSERTTLVIHPETPVCLQAKTTYDSGCSPKVAMRLALYLILALYYNGRKQTNKVTNRVRWIRFRLFSSHSFRRP